MPSEEPRRPRLGTTNLGFRSRFFVSVGSHLIVLVGVAVIGTCDGLRGIVRLLSQQCHLLAFAVVVAAAPFRLSDTAVTALYYLCILLSK